MRNCINIGNSCQEESRSISENVTWGQHQSFANGNIYLVYVNLLGYKKGEDNRPEIVEEEAKLVRLIYNLYLTKNMTTKAIADYLTSLGYKSPMGKDVWHPLTVCSILKNEKYKGHALLQKKITIDFLQHKSKKNEGEVPQYYIEDSHEAIIEPEEWE